MVSSTAEKDKEPKGGIDRAKILSSARNPLHPGAADLPRPKVELKFVEGHLPPTPRLASAASLVRIEYYQREYSVGLSTFKCPRLVYSVISAVICSSQNILPRLHMFRLPDRQVMGHEESENPARNFGMEYILLVLLRS
jgi:hypothetical protein